HLANTQTAGLGEMLAQVEIKEAALHIALVAAEQGSRLQRLAHLLDQHGEKHTLKSVGDLVEVPIVARVRLSREHFWRLAQRRNRDLRSGQHIHDIPPYKITSSA